MSKGYEIEVKQQGPSNAVLVLAMVAALVLSFAVWTIAAQVGAAILAIGVGLGIRNALVGVAFVIRQRGEAQAAIERARRTGQLEPPRRAELVEGESWRT